MRSVAARHAQTVTEEFGQRARERRLELRLSQEKVAERAGLDRTYIGGIERGERNLSLVNLVTLAHALEIDPAKLVGELRP
jgi:transcriptional regulator with XRE-family HTH domain